jgi:hypothetical protein
MPFLTQKVKLIPSVFLPFAGFYGAFYTTSFPNPSKNYDTAPKLPKSE